METIDLDNWLEEVYDDLHTNEERAAWEAEQQWIQDCRAQAEAMGRIFG